MHGATSIDRSMTALAGIGLAILGLAACAGDPDLERASSPTATSPAEATGAEEPSPRPTPSEVMPSTGATGASVPSDGVRVARLLRGLDAEDASDGVVVTFDASALFGIDSAELTSDGKQVLADLIEALGLLDDAPILIHGHSDRGGAGEDAEVFAHQRAAAIAVYVVEEGVSADRLTVDGFGQSDDQRVEVILPTVDMDVRPSS